MAAGQRPAAMVIASVLLAILVGPLNSTMIAVAMPAVSREFGASVSTGTWLVTVYLITMASLMPVAGKLGDRLGHRPVLLGGLVVFFAASAAATFAPSLAVLLACRVGQAVGAAVLMPSSISILRDVVPPDRLGRMFGIVGMVAPLAAAAGPPVGSALLAVSGWRALFAVNLVLLVLPVTAGWFLLPRQQRTRRGPFDVLGSVTVCLVLVAFAMLLDRSGSWWATVGWALLLAVSGVAFVVRELRHPDPAVQLRLLRIPSFLAASAGVMLSNFAMYGTLLALPLLLAVRADWPEPATGVVLALMMGAVAALGPVGGWLFDRFGGRLPTVLGFVVLAGGLALLAIGGGRLSVVTMGGCLVVCGIGLGLAMPALQTASVQAVDKSETGMASGVFATIRYLGSITCAALLAGPLATVLHRDVGFTVVFAVYTAVMVVGVALVALLPLLGRTASRYHS